VQDGLGAPGALEIIEEVLGESAQVDRAHRGNHGGPMIFPAITFF
jgi:hypothetical protein